MRYFILLNLSNITHKIAIKILRKSWKQIKKYPIDKMASLYFLLLSMLFFSFGILILSDQFIKMINPMD